MRFYGLILLLSLIACSNPRVNYTQQLDDTIKRFHAVVGKDKIESKTLLDSIWQIAYTSKSNLQISRANNCKGEFFENYNVYDSALIYYLKSLSIKKEIQDSIGLAETNMIIAQYYSNFNQTDVQEKYLNEAKKFIQKDNTNSLFNWYSNMAYCNAQKSDLIKTKQYFRMALHLAETVQQDKLLLAQENYGSILNQLEEIDSAKYFYNLCLKNYEAKSDTLNLATTYHNIALLYWNTQFSDSVEFYLNRSYALSKSTKKKLALDMYLKSLSDFWDNQGNAVLSRKYLVELDSYRSVQFQSDLSTKISDVEKGYLVKSQKEENATLKAELSAKNILRNASIVIAVFLLIILMYQFKLNKQKRLIADQEKQMQEREIDRLLKEIEVVGITSVIEGGEKEKQRIGRDLHDRLGSMLSIAKLHMSNIKSENNDSHQKALDIIDEAVGEVRKIAHDLNSSFLVSNGLSAALNELKRSIDASGRIRVSVFENTDKIDYSSEFEIAVFRIIQEAISNVLKHADASKIDIHLTSQDNKFTLLIEDNGKGFDSQKSNRGIGLMNIKQRVLAMNGEFNIDSKIGKGTTIIVELDYLQQSN